MCSVRRAEQSARKLRWYRDVDSPSAYAGGFYFAQFPVNILIFRNEEERVYTMTLYEELQARGLIAQVTDEEEIKELINNGKATFYIGF